MLMLFLHNTIETKTYRHFCKTVQADANRKWRHQVSLMLCTVLTGRAYVGSMGSRLQSPMRDRPAMPKKVWNTSTMSCGRSEMPPLSSSCTVRQEHHLTGCSHGSSSPHCAPHAWNSPDACHMVLPRFAKRVCLSSCTTDHS